MNGDKALNNAIANEMDRDAGFMDKCNYHQELMDKHNTTGKSPMELADSSAGQTLLDEINAKVAAAMVARFGE